MKMLTLVGGLALPFLLAACGEATNPQDRRQGAAANASATVTQPSYAAEGEVTAVAGDRLTISHGAVEGLGWPPMTMAFQNASPQVVRGIAVGDRVRFEFHQSGGSYVLSSIAKQ